MTEGEKQKQLDREIRDMISALTRRLGDLQHVHKPHGDSSHDHQDINEDYHDHHSFGIITLAGSNIGATMRSELDVENSKPNSDDHQGEHEHEDEPLTSFVNSNFQAINNSLMLGGSYSTNDPGVHMDVSDGYNTMGHQAARLKHGKNKQKKKGKETSESTGKETSKSTDHDSQNSD